MKRHPELDILRTAAILLMVVYHTAFDLSQFYGYDIAVFSGGWYMLARGTATLFVLLTGVSAALSYGKMNGLPVTTQWRRHLTRFARIGAAAMLVSAVTYAADPETFVRFGILHLIALSALLLPLFARLKEGTVPTGAACIIAGLYTADLRTDSWLLLPLGIRPFGFRTVDYFPLMPWFGVMLIGYGIGYWWYVRKMRNENGEMKTRITHLMSHSSFLVWPGRHSLLVYLIHQPLILLILTLVLGKPRL